MKSLEPSPRILVSWTGEENQTTDPTRNSFAVVQADVYRRSALTKFNWTSPRIEDFE